MEITTTSQGVQINMSAHEWGEYGVNPWQLSNVLTAIVPVQVTSLQHDVRPQHFVLNQYWSPGERSGEHIGIGSSTGIEDELPGLVASVYAAVRQRENISYSYECPKGGGPPDQLLTVCIDCAKDAFKALAGVALKAIFDYYRNRRSKITSDKHVIYLYGPNDKVCKKVVIEGRGDDARITEEKENFVIPDPFEGVD